MHLLFVLLPNDACLENVVLALTGVSGGLVTMIDAVSGISDMTRGLPVFAGILGTNRRRFCKMLVTCVEGDNPVRRFFDMLSDAGIDRDDCGVGEAFSVPLREAVVLASLDVL